MLRAIDIMTKDVPLVKGSATVAEAIRLMRLKGLGALIVDVRDPDDAYGIITQTDIVYKVVAYGKDPNKMRVYEIMTKPCITVNPDLGVEYVARLFANARIRVAPVIQGKLLGMVTLSDILKRGDYLENPRAVALTRQLQAAIAEARSVCQAEGFDSAECIQAWEKVEELEAEVAYLENAPPVEITAFQQYCLEHPEILRKRHQDLVAAEGEKVG
ncbi:MAG: CBS domain-containing protein [Pseudanabaenaceae cyanobacterium SKYGB_i_bin29]|nr:CBS domain-containing protein [Pseudanabaenaceae cyanobacterium SKYG29]MDW8422243.1 CBS domain-containing protein [Pseudanabaenaceae cyanobacterium SKYGB_i_bin29]